MKVRVPFRSPSEQLLDAAKANPAIRRAFVEVILKARPHLMAGDPDIADRDLVTAIRVAHQFWFEKKWSDLKERLNRLLLERHLWGSHPLDADDLRRCQTVLRTLARETGMDAGPFLRTLEEVKPSWEEHASQREKRLAGRHLSEMSHRVIASVHLLKKCGERRAIETVSAALCELALGKMEPDSVRRLVARYKANSHNQPLDDLLDVWLLAMSHYLEPIVAASKKADLGLGGRIGKGLKGRD